MTFPFFFFKEAYQIKTNIYFSQTRNFPTKILKKARIFFSDSKLGKKQIEQKHFCCANEVKFVHTCTCGMNSEYNKLYNTLVQA